MFSNVDNRLLAEVAMKIDGLIQNNQLNMQLGDQSAKLRHLDGAVQKLAVAQDNQHLLISSQLSHQATQLSHQLDSLRHSLGFLVCRRFFEQYVLIFSRSPSPELYAISLRCILVLLTMLQRT